MPGSAVRLSGRVNGTIKAEGNLLDEDQNFTGWIVSTANFTELSFRVEDVQPALRRLWLFVLPERDRVRQRQVHRARHEYRARRHAG